jgi:hypothetical protein
MGFTRAYVSAGGDSRIIGDRFGKPWMVGIRDPRKGPGEVITRIPLVDAAISTSGDYERFFEEDGVRYHHIIDPHTGHSASKVRSATIIGPMRRAPTVCRRPRSCWGPRRPWRSTIASTTSMPSSSSSTAASMLFEGMQPARPRTSMLQT